MPQSAALDCFASLAMTGSMALAKPALRAKPLSMKAALIPLEDAQNLLASMLAPVAPRFFAPAQAVGHVVAETICAEGPVPRSHIALRDGYGLVASEIAGASSYSPVPLAIRPVHVQAGDALPAGCDCVVEDGGVDVSGPFAQALVDSFPGENIRRMGDDFAAGAVLVEQGEILRETHVLALAAAGVERLSIVAPKFCVHGDGPLARFLAGSLVRAGAVLDDEAQLQIILGDGRDCEMIARGLALEPGRDIALARKDNVPVIVIPPLAGDIVAALHALILPALNHLCQRPMRPAQSLPLAAKISSRVGLSELVLLLARDGQFHPLAIGDAPLQFFLQATHVALVGAASEGHAAGDLFSAFSLEGVAQ